MRLVAVGLAVVALTACGGEDEPAADVAAVTCSDTGLTVTPRVRSQPDGSVQVEADVRGQGVSLTVNGQPARGGTVMQLSPGNVRVKCRHANGSMEASFEVVEGEQQSGG